MTTATFHLKNGEPVTLSLDSRGHYEFASSVSMAVREDGSLSKDASARLEQKAYAFGMAFYEAASSLVKRLRYDCLVRVERA